MKFYIPTTSLNFNCILSSESVSPVGFYRARGFGYSRWFTIPENDQEGAVLLYSKPFSLKRPQSDLEDHPMMLEIDTGEKFEEVADGVFACDHTIYLNSLSDKIILFSDKDKDTVLSLSESSLETKMLRFYKRRIVVHSFEGDAPDVSNVSRIPLKQAAIEHDQRINKIKGLLYGYYIGALLSADSEDVARLNIFREIQDIFSAVVSSEHCRPTDAQSRRLSELFSVLRRDEPLFAELVNLVGDEHKAGAVIALARKYGYVLTAFDEERLVRELTVVTTENPSLGWIKSKIGALCRTMQGKRRRLSVESDEIVSESTGVLKISDKVLSGRLDNQLFLAWVNEVLSRTEFNGKISTIKEHLSDELTVVAKGVLGEEWKDGNAVRSFMNDLRRHVRGADFAHSWNNGVLSSMAAVVTKGDDWNKLLIFMQSNGMTDYRLAFAFYGMLNGFANLTRDFTDILLNQEPQYLIEVYREFYGELHGIAVRVPEVSPMASEKSNVAGGNPSKVGGDGGETVALQTSAANIAENHPDVCDDGVEAPSVFNQILLKFEGLKIATRKGVSKDTLRNGLKLAIAELGIDQDSHKLLNLLVGKYANPYGWRKTIKPWKELKKFVADCVLNSKMIQELPGLGAQEGFEIAKLGQKRTWQKLCGFDERKHHEQIQGNGLLVHDKELCAEIEKRFADFGETRVRMLTNAVIKFCDRYTASEGFYGKHPENYRQANPDLIDHLLRCFKSDKTRDINFRLNEEEEQRFVVFLEERYSCKRRTRKA